MGNFPEKPSCCWKWSWWWSVGGNLPSGQKINPIAPVQQQRHYAVEDGILERLNPKDPTADVSRSWGCPVLAHSIFFILTFILFREGSTEGEVSLSGMPRSKTHRSHHYTFTPGSCTVQLQSDGIKVEFGQAVPLTFTTQINPAGWNKFWLNQPILWSQAHISNH